MAAAEAEIVSEGGVVGGAHSSREARNLAEKNRRDKLNASIQELASMVPHVASSTRRPDKTGILRSATHGLRLQYVFGKSVPRRPRSGHMAELTEAPQFTDALTDLLDSFFITLTCHGQIVVISASIEQLLGHCQSDLHGQNILSITHPDDQSRLLQQLIPRDMEALFRSSNEYRLHHPSSGNEDDEALESDCSAGDYYQQETTQQTHRSNSPEHTDAYLNDIDRRLRNDRRTFTVRLARAGTRTEATRKYELMKFDGCFRRSDYSCSAGTFPIVSQLIRRTRNNGSVGLHMMQHDVIAQAAMHGISGNDVVLVAMARIIRSPKIINYFSNDNGRLEYRTRHLIDGRIVDCDQRIGLVAGYMKKEVFNLSPFSFMHQDDVRWVIVALRQMYDNNEDRGESYYRLLTANGRFIYLHSIGYIDVADKSRNVYSFVCINTLLDEEEGRRRLQQMKDKFSTIIKTKIPSNSLLDVPASENPQQLERIVLYLIDNLQPRHDNGSGTGCGEDTTTQADNVRYAKTPPLSLVPPEPASVKSSISQSVSVVNVTVAKNMQKNLNQMKSPHSVTSSDLSLSPASSIDLGDDFGDHMGAVPPTSIHSNTAPATITQRPTVLQLNTQASTSAPLTCAPQSPPQRPSPKSPRSVLEQRLTAPPQPTTSSAHMTAAYNCNGANDALQQPMSVLKRLRPAASSSTATSINSNSINCSTTLEESVSPAKRCQTAIPVNSSPELLPTSIITKPAEIHAVISNSLENIDQSLQSIQQNARTLSQQHARLLPKTVVPYAFNHKLDAIFVEHQRQAEQLINIKNEYDVHLQQQQQQFALENFAVTETTHFQQLQLQLQQPQEQQPDSGGGGVELQLTVNYAEPTAMLNQLEKRL
ncbi:uncharacterized protein LOC129236786 [Anastrepha obliqua]|uniref:uncharacterized protein LOC129236786 n=1 Tax=Anastrepha obliqua TaxID=95512 RepID=UPI00240973E0|nr:uncharacterized protein LOC129236786 [Anastrepha obliqua]